KGLWPSLLILDWRVPWTRPAKEMPECPDEVKNDGYHENAGRRCFEYLRAAEKSVESKVQRVTSVLFYSILHKDDIFGRLAEKGYTPQGGKFGYFSKEESGDHLKLEQTIQMLLQH
ncbi:MAG: hypothetical protein AABX37_06025, partial [Nanoarchaeota archaeon]